MIRSNFYTKINEIVRICELTGNIDVMTSIKEVEGHFRDLDNRDLVRQRLKKIKKIYENIDKK